MMDIELLQKIIEHDFKAPAIDARTIPSNRLVFVFNQEASDNRQKILGRVKGIAKTLGNDFYCCETVQLARNIEKEYSSTKRFNSLGVLFASGDGATLFNKRADIVKQPRSFEVLGVDEIWYSSSFGAVTKFTTQPRFV